MRRESAFEKNIKWMIWASLSVGALCHIIMVFSEFSAYSGIGTVFNLLYHLGSAVAFGLIFLSFYSMSENTQVYSGYLFGLTFALGAIVDICLMFMLISTTKGTTESPVVLIIFIVILFALEAFLAFLFVRYALDRVTCVLPMVLVFVDCILKGTVFSRADYTIHLVEPTKEAVKTAAAIADQATGQQTIEKISHGNVYSIWFLMALIFLLIAVISVCLYFDNSFLSEVMQNPKDIFTKKTFFGTYTNLYLLPEKEPKKKVELRPEKGPTEETTKETIEETIKETIKGTTEEAKKVEGSKERICQECGFPLENGMSICPECGCPVEELSDTKTGQADTDQPVSASQGKKICPECGCPLDPGQTICMECGYPIQQEEKENVEDGSSNEEGNGNGID